MLFFYFISRQWSVISRQDYLSINIHAKNRYRVAPQADHG